MNLRLFDECTINLVTLNAAHSGTIYLLRYTVFKKKTVSLWCLLRENGPMFNSEFPQRMTRYRRCKFKRPKRVENLYLYIGMLYSSCIVF